MKTLVNESLGISKPVAYSSTPFETIAPNQPIFRLQFKYFAKLQHNTKNVVYNHRI